MSAAGPAAGRVALAGTVTLSGSATGYIAVRLPRPAELLQPPAYGSTPFATGGGRYLGYVLTDDKPDGVRILGGMQAGSAFGAYAFAIQGVPDEETFRLPAGDYRLYLLADGAPATVTLLFKGLTGTAALRPPHRVPYTLASPTVLVTPAGNVGVAGAEATLAGRGLVFDFLTDRNAVFLTSNTQLCFYDTPPPPQPVGYGPGCPGGAPANLTNTAPGVGGTTGAAFSGIADLPAGRYGQGFNRVGVAVTDTLTYSAGFLSFDAPRSTAAPLPVPTRTAAAAAGDRNGVPAVRGARGEAAPLPATGLPPALPGAATALIAATLAVTRRRGTG